MKNLFTINPSRSGKVFGIIAIIALLSFAGCGKKKGPPANMAVNLRMPITINGSDFPSNLLDRIEIYVTGQDGYRWPIGHNQFGTFSQDCNPSFGSFCPQQASFPINVPNEGDYTIYVVAQTGSCAAYGTAANSGCKTKTGQLVGSLQKFDWQQEELFGAVSANGTIDLSTTSVSAKGHFTITNKCCCNPIVDNQMCGVQPNFTKNNTCVPYTFLSSNSTLLTGLCGADDEYGCANLNDAKDANGDCGTKCNVFESCTYPYECSSKSNTDGVCLKPCTTTSNCPSGQGCNTGYCK